jgi:hypothetical protein
VAHSVAYPRYQQIFTALGVKEKVVIRTPP